MEGNINYTGAVISWLKNDVGLISSAGETEAMALAANPADTTCLIPAFTGLGAPYWKNEAKAILCGISRTTGKNEIVRAALDCIAFQIHDVIAAMEKDTDIQVSVLRVDGGPTRNHYLMQLQSDLLNAKVICPGLSAGIFDEQIFSAMHYQQYEPSMDQALRQEKQCRWQEALHRATLDI